MVPQAQLRDPAKYLQEAVSEFAATGQLQGAVRVPGAVAPIKITADLRAGLIHCAVTVPAPPEGPADHPRQLAGNPDAEPQRHGHA